jgi:WD40 repeat protein
VDTDAEFSFELVSWSPDGARIAALDVDKVFIWDAEDWDERLTLPLGENSADGIAWSPSGTRLATHSDEAVILWDAETGASLRALEGILVGGEALDWSPDGSRIVASDVEDLRIWDVQSGEILKTLQGHVAYVNAVAWSPDGKWIASGANDDSLRIWDAERGSERHALRGHLSGIESLAWSPDSERVVTGSSDEDLRVWDPIRGACLHVLKGHEGHVESVAWSPDGNRIVSASGDETFRVWESRFEDALPMWRAESNRQRAEQASELNTRAWALVDPDPQEEAFAPPEIPRLPGEPIAEPRQLSGEDDFAFGLRLAQAATALAPEESNIRDTLAWALFANGLHDEALIESARALELAPEDEKDDYQGYLDRMRAMIEEAQASAPEDN